MFDFLKSKAGMRLELDSETTELEGIVSGKIRIAPTVDFTSNALILCINPEDLIFRCEIPFYSEYEIQSRSVFESWMEYDIPFEITCTSIKEMQGWFSIHKDHDWLHDDSAPQKKFDGFEEFLLFATNGNWTISAHFDIPGFDVSDTKSIRVLQTR